MKHLGGGGAEPMVCGLVSLGDGGRRHGAGASALARAARGWRILRRLRQSQRLEKFAAGLGHDQAGSAIADEIVPVGPLRMMELLAIHHLAKQLLSHEFQGDRHFHGRHDRIMNRVICDHLARLAVVELPRIRGVVFGSAELLVPLVEAAQHITDGDALRLAGQDVFVRAEDLLHDTINIGDMFVA